MKKRNIIIGAAFASLVGVVSIANAATIKMTGGGTAVFSNNTVATASVNKASAAAQVGTLHGAAFTAPYYKVGDVITLTVTGAKFDRANLPVPTVVFTKGAGSNAATTVPAVAGGFLLDATNTILTGTVTTASVNATTGTSPAEDIIATFVGSYDLKGAPVGNPRLTMTISRTAFGATTVVSSSASSLKLFNVVAPIHTVTPGAPGTAKVDPASAFTKFVVPTGSTTTTATSVTAPNTTIPASTLPDASVGNVTTKGSILVKLSGLPIAATKVVWPLATAANESQSTATAGTAPTTATAGSDFWLDGLGNGYMTINTAGVKAGLSAGTIALTVDGTTVIPATTVNATLTYVPGTGDNYVAHTILAATPVIKITRSGSSFTSDNISATSIVRISENSAASTVASAITYAAFDAAGAPVTQVGTTLPTSILAGHTVTIAKGVLKAAYPTALRFNINVESSNVSVTHLKNTGTGLNVIVKSTGADKQL